MKYRELSWTDRLSSYNGQAITYDSLGNPLSYRGATLTWNGRLLMSYEKDGTKYAYTYNADNLRTSKSKYVNNTLVSKETYIWSGDALVATKKYDCATATSDVIRYLYDSNGESYGFTYNGKTYLYVKNLQGDVIAIISAGDELLCLGLVYDPWGNVTYMTDEEADEYELQVAQEIAAINNIAYRGYFYDSETGLYYLQSRYYDPEVGRFINADDTKYIGYDDTPLSCNAFAYCCNDPINREDKSGNIAFTFINCVIIGAIVGIATGTITGAYQGYKSGKRGWRLVGVAVRNGIYWGAVGAATGGFIYCLHSAIVAKYSSKVALSIAQAAKGRQTVRVVNKISSNVIQKAISNKSRLSHAYKHIGNIVTGMNWSNAACEKWKDWISYGLKNYSATFLNKLGQYNAVGYYICRGGKNFAIYIYLDGPYRGLIATVVELSANQMKKFGLW